MGKLEFSYKANLMWVLSVAWSPDSKYIVLGGGNNAGKEHMQVVDVLTGTCVFSTSSHTDMVSTVSWSPDGKYIASGGWDMRVIVWDASAGLREKIRDRNLSGKLIVAGTSHFDLVRSVKWLPDSRHVVIVGDSRRLKILNIENRSEFILKLSEQALCVEVNEHSMWNTSFLMIVGMADGGIKLYNESFKSLEEYMEMPRLHSKAVWALAWNNNGTHLASGGDDNIICVWNTFLNKTDFYKGHSAPIRSLSWSPMEMRLASGSEDGTVRILYV